MTKIKSEDAEFIKANYKGVSTRQMARLLYEATGTSVTKNTIYLFYKKWGLDSGLDGKFKKGYKGLNENQKVRIKSTQFKKGHLSSNKMPIGVITQRDDGYKYVKVGKDKWEREHNVIWREAHGKIPKGYSVWHLDGDGYNNNLDNLILVSANESILVNGFGLTQDAQVNKSIVLNTRLKQTLKKYGK